MAWIRAATLSELRPGAMKRVTLEGRSIVLIRLDGAFHAVDDECPHLAGGSLSRGTLDSMSVWCPLHGARFALGTGETLQPPEGEALAAPTDRGVRTYRVNVAGDVIYIDL